jgi:hypothetical protein
MPKTLRTRLRPRTPMKTTTLTYPELILIATTRGMLGAGLALLVSKRLSQEQRETAGVILTAIGILTTFPLVLEVLGKTESYESQAVGRRT